MLLLQNDSFRDINAWFDQVTGRTANSAQWPMPMDAYKRGDDLWVHIDLPGIAAESLDIDVERNVLTISAQRNWQPEDGDQMYLAERHRGAFRRQVHLGDGLDAERIAADYHDGVLTLRIPVAETARPRKIAINTSRQGAIEAESADSNETRDTVSTG